MKNKQYIMKEDGRMMNKSVDNNIALSIEKWNTILQLKEETHTTADLYFECYWLCVEFGLNTKSELMFIMHPLQVHPYGKEFGFAPSSLSCYIFTESEILKYFDIKKDKTYKEIQKNFLSENI